MRRNHPSIEGETAVTEYERGICDGIEMAAAYLESQSAKSSVPELTAYRTWAHEIRKLKDRS